MPAKAIMLRWRVLRPRLTPLWGSMASKSLPLPPSFGGGWMESEFRGEDLISARTFTSAILGYLKGHADASDG